MEFDVDRTVEVLRSTPSVVRGLLGGKSAPSVRRHYGPRTFSPLDVVVHLIQGERTDWSPRAAIIVESGTARPFDPFDPTAGYDEGMGSSIDELLDLFESLRAANLVALESMSLSPEHLDRRGTHPELGTVTLGQLLATWAVHDLHHIAQICKAMAHQYRAAVGPWAAYLSILPRAGIAAAQTQPG